MNDNLVLPVSFISSWGIDVIAADKRRRHKPTDGQINDEQRRGRTFCASFLLLPSTELLY